MAPMLRTVSLDLGHPGVAARPFIGPVFTANEAKAEAAFAKVFFESWAK